MMFMTTFDKNFVMTLYDYFQKYLLFNSLDSIVFDILHLVLCLVLIRFLWCLGSKIHKK